MREAFKGSIVLLAAVTLAACGTDEKAVHAAKTARAQADTAHQEQTRLEKHASELRDAADEATSEAEDCKDKTGPLMRKVGDLNSRLDVGLNYDSYSTEVADIKVAYDRSIPDGNEHTLKCLKRVGVPIEKSFNRYLAAYRTWNACIEDFGCDTDSINDGLQAQWLKASVFDSVAEDGLKALTHAGARAQSSLDEASSRADQARQKADAADREADKAEAAAK